MAKHRTLYSYNQISIRFPILPPLSCPETQAALAHIALLPGCLDYALTCREQEVFQWSISGIWVNEEDRQRHYCSEQIQVLFRCLIQRNASMICCSEGQTEHLWSTCLGEQLAVRQR